jgi:hypothetical protein
MNKGRPITETERAQRGLTGYFGGIDWAKVEIRLLKYRRAGSRGRASTLFYMPSMVKGDPLALLCARLGCPIESFEDE